MPVITVKMGKPHLEQSQELIEALTATAAKVLNAPESAFTVFLDTYELELVGSGGKTLKHIIENKSEHH